MTAVKHTNRLYCNHCEQTAERRRDLDEHFLCAKCRMIPGVRGYRDPSKRGIEGGSPAYYERTKGQLNIITDEPAPTSSASQPPTWKAYQAIVRARSDLDNGDKLLFERLAAHGDYKTGANSAWPIAKLAVEVGKSERWVKLHLHQLKRVGVIEVIPLRSRRSWAQNLYRFVGHGFDCPLDCSKVKHAAPSRGPRPRCDRDAATGRFRSEKLPLAKGKGFAPSIQDLRARGMPDIDLAVEGDLASDLSDERTTAGRRAEG